MSATRQEASDGINQLEGYLLLEAERSSARHDAEEFAARMPWLTGGQREEIVRLYTEDRRRLTRQTLERIADRATELRGEYNDRYRQLRLATWCTAAAVIPALTTVFVLLLAGTG
ncbi:hypothetical protein GCM10010406_51670 [Streptomyces thermolineatus]|uniref:Cytochrome C oxidase subunit I n=1 Tax=Streptomyces thermolineatus TaxID=44033 RepID=A0ABN3MU01_9ACTN|nr:hypothetical protein [Streptomyces sp. HB2AG]MCZ2524837.1 hypothetical protein [Streptomyces sp. HB2AG]